MHKKEAEQFDELLRMYLGYVMVRKEKARHFYCTSASFQDIDEALELIHEAMYEKIPTQFLVYMEDEINKLGVMSARQEFEEDQD